MKRIICTLLCIGAVLSANAQVVINEYSASNTSHHADYQGDFVDYVELFNTSATAVPLGGYYLSDDATDLSKWPFPATATIPANGRLMVYCSNKNLVSPGGQLHTNFKLTQCKADKIILIAPGLAVVDSLTMQRTQLNHSRGRLGDGNANWGVFTNPNPNATNNGGFAAYADRPVMSVAPGFYNAAQNITLTTTQPNITIRYTLDGSTPTAASTAYAGPIAIPTTKVLRAACYSSDPTITRSFTESNTYFINVTHSGRFNVISVSGAYTTTLFGSGQAITTSFEFFDSSKTFKWEFEGRAQRHGHDSWAYQQKSFKVYAKDEYGYLNTMPEHFFDGTTRDKFDMVILKAAASDNYPGNVGNNTAHMRDAYAHTYSIKYNMEFDERKYAPTVIYVNGNYWGVYEIRERVDEDYTDYYYGQKTPNVDIVRHWGGGTNIIDAGSDTGWTNLRNFIVNNNMTVPANYAYVDSKLNVKSLMDFFIYNNYLANSDHMNWNTMWWRGRKAPEVKWKYVLWDMDNIFDLGENFTGLPTTGPELNPCAPFNLFLNSNIIFHTQMINKLMTNPTFKKEYTDRYVYWLNKALNCDSLLLHLDYFYNLLKPEMPAHCTRWGGNMVTWEAHVDSVREFILNRCKNITLYDTCMKLDKIVLNVQSVGQGNIKFGDSLLSVYPHRQFAKTDSVYSILAIPNTGYVFDKWLVFKPGTIVSPNIYAASALLDYKVEDSIVAVFKVKPPDTFSIKIDAAPQWAGTVLLDGIVLLSQANFPYTLKAVEKTNHTLLATPDVDHKWNSWTQVNGATNPLTVGNLKEKSIAFTANGNDEFVAHFDSIIKVIKKVYIPNAFSPNGDGKNDYFGIDSKNNITVSAATAKVYNRYGELVYSGNALNTGWVGKHNGVDAETGTYVYAIVVTYCDGSKRTFDGDVMLVR